MPKTGRHFRLHESTNKQMSLLARQLGITQTEVVQMAVQLLASEYLPSESRPPLRVAESGEPHTNNTDEGLARQYDEVADLYEADEGLKPEFREAVVKLMRGTAASLRREES